MNYKNFMMNIFEYDEVNFFKVYFPNIKLIKSQ